MLNVGMNNMYKKGAQLKKKIGNFSSQCCSRQASVTIEKNELKDSYNESQFLGAVTSDSLTQWNEKIEINKQFNRCRSDSHISRHI